MSDGLLHLVVVEESSDPKVGYLELVLVIQQYVVRFDITVDDLSAAIVVQILQPHRDGYRGSNAPALGCGQSDSDNE